MRAISFIDLGSFDTSKVVSMNYMFENTLISTIVVDSDLFVTTQVEDSEGMFEDSYYLVGESGTEYDSMYVDKTYARVDNSGAPRIFYSIKSILFENRK